MVVLVKVALALLPTGRAMNRFAFLVWYAQAHAYSKGPRITILIADGRSDAVALCKKLDLGPRDFSPTKRALLSSPSLFFAVVSVLQRFSQPHRRHQKRNILISLLRDRRASPSPTPTMGTPEAAMLKRPSARWLASSRPWEAEPSRRARCLH